MIARLLTNRFFIALVSGLALFAAAYWSGWQAHAHKVANGAVKAAAGVVKTIQKQEVVTDKIATEHEQTRERVRTVTRTITKEIPRYVSPEAVSRCDVPDGFVRVHDAAAAGVLPDPPSELDAAPSGVGIDQVAGTVVENYGTCAETSAQLIALQAWVREQQALAGPKLRH